MPRNLHGEYEEAKVYELLVRDGEQAGIVLREKLNEDLRNATDLRRSITRYKLGWVFDMSAPSFYAMMADLEDIDAVESRDEQIDVHGHAIMQRLFKIKEEGMRIREELRSKHIVPNVRLSWNV